QVRAETETRILCHEGLQLLPGDGFEARDVKEMLDGRLHGLVHVCPFYQLENSLLKISSVSCWVIVGKSWVSASVMEVDAGKSKFRDTSVSKLAGATFFPVGSRLF